MKNLWAPWRMEYIAKNKSDECIFCSLPKAGQDNKNKILFQGPSCFVIMNIFPYNNGHIMVCPYRHISCLTLLTEDELIEISQVTQKSVETSSFGPRVARVRTRRQHFGVSLLWSSCSLRFLVWFTCAWRSCL